MMSRASLVEFLQHGEIIWLSALLWLPLVSFVLGGKMRRLEKANSYMEDGNAEAAIAAFKKKDGVLVEGLPYEAHRILFQAYQQLGKHNETYHHGTRAWDLADGMNKMGIFMDVELFLASSGWNTQESIQFCEQSLKFHKDPDVEMAVKWHAATLYCFYDVGFGVDARKVKKTISKLSKILKQVPQVKKRLKSMLDSALFKGYAVLGQAAKVAHFFGLTQTETGYKPFSSQVGEAYATPPNFDELPVVPLNTVPFPSVFMSAIPFKRQVLLRIRDFLRFSFVKHVVGKDDNFVGHLWDPAATPVTLIDNVLMAMHQNLPEDLRKQAKFAEWWTHIRPEHRTGNGTIRAQTCHEDDTGGGNVGHLALATSVLYLANGTEATLVTNINRFKKERHPLAWVIPPRASISATFPSSWVHCVLPSHGIIAGPMRVSINVMWLKGPCSSDTGVEGKICMQRPRDGWDWESEIKAEYVLQSSSPVETVIVPSSVPLYKSSGTSQLRSEL